MKKCTMRVYPCLRCLYKTHSKNEWREHIEKKSCSLRVFTDLQQEEQSKIMENGVEDATDIDQYIYQILMKGVKNKDEFDFLSQELKERWNQEKRTLQEFTLFEPKDIDMDDDDEVEIKDNLDILYRDVRRSILKKENKEYRLNTKEYYFHHLLSRNKKFYTGFQYVDYRFDDDKYQIEMNALKNRDHFRLRGYDEMLDLTHIAYEEFIFMFMSVNMFEILFDKIMENEHNYHMYLESVESKDIILFIKEFYREGLLYQNKLYHYKTDLFFENIINQMYEILIVLNEKLVTKNRLGLIYHQEILPITKKTIRDTYKIIQDNPNIYRELVMKIKQKIVNKKDDIYRVLKANTQDRHIYYGTLLEIGN